MAKVQRLKVKTFFQRHTRLKKHWTLNCMYIRSKVTRCKNKLLKTQYFSVLFNSGIILKLSQPQHGFNSKILRAILINILLQITYFPHIIQHSIIKLYIKKFTISNNNTWRLNVNQKYFFLLSKLETFFISHVSKALASSGISPGSFLCNKKI